MADKYILTTGDTFNAQLTLTDVDGSAVNLTGATVKFSIDDRNGTQVAQQSVTSHTTPASGITTVTIAAATTANWTTGGYLYAVQVTLSTAEVFTAQRGVIEVLEKRAS